jgi:hypothetical protein
LAGTLRGLLDKPAEVSRGIRAGSVFVLPIYVWIAVFVGRYHDKPWGDYLGEILVVSPLVVLSAISLVQLLTLTLRTTASQAIFRLAVVDASGEPAAISRLLRRWAIAWLPLLLPLSAVALAVPRAEGIAIISALTLLLLWVCAAITAVIHPNQGVHDRLAGTSVVRR